MFLCQKVVFPLCMKWTLTLLAVLHIDSIYICNKNREWKQLILKNIQMWLIGFWRSHEAEGFCITVVFLKDREKTLNFTSADLMYEVAWPIYFKWKHVEKLQLKGS